MKTAEHVEKPLYPSNWMVVEFSARGRCKRTPVNAYDPRPPRWKGVKDMVLPGDDRATALLVLPEEEHVLLLTTAFRTHLIPVEEIPLSGVGEGEPESCVPLSGEEEVALAVPWPEESPQVWVMLTQGGWARRFRGSEVAEGAKEGRRLRHVKDWWGPPRLFLPGEEEMALLVVTYQGQGLYVPVDRLPRVDASPLPLQVGDSIAGGVVAGSAPTVVLVSPDGRGMRRSTDAFPPSESHRSWGVMITQKTRVQGIAPVREQDDVFILSAQGRIHRLPARLIPLRKNRSRGIRLSLLPPRDKVAAITSVTPVAIA